MRGFLTIGRTGAISSRIDAVVAGFPIHRIDHGVTTTRDEVRTPKSTAAVRSVVDAIVADFTKPTLDNAIATIRLFART